MHKTARHLTFIFTLITAMTVLHAQAAQDLVLTSDALPDSASVDFRHKSWKLSHTGTQGMDTYGNYLVSLKAEGICQVYSFDGKTLTALTNDFHLGSYDPINHANLASFSNQFYADGMQQDGVGDLYRRFLELKEKLSAEGLFDAARKRPLPLLPRKVGIVTSDSGAVLHDIRPDHAAERLVPSPIHRDVPESRHEVRIADKIV